MRNTEKKERCRETGRYWCRTHIIEKSRQEMKIKRKDTFQEEYNRKDLGALENNTEGEKYYKSATGANEKYDPETAVCKKINQQHDGGI